MCCLCMWGRWRAFPCKASVVSPITVSTRIRMYPVVSKRLLRVLANDGLIRMLRNKLASDTTFSAELHDTSRYQKNIYISNLGGRCERAEFCDTSDTTRYEKAYTYQTWVGGVNWSSFPIQLIRTDTKKHIHIKLGLEV